MMGGVMGKRMLAGRTSRLAFFAMVVGLVMAGVGVARAVVAPSPGVVAGGFCTYPTGALKTSAQAAQRINQYFAVGGEIFHVGDPRAYTWQTTGTTVTVGSGKNAVSVDGGVATLLQAIGTAGRPGAFSSSATNPTTWARAESWARRRSR
jgi:hypothetical protein